MARFIASVDAVGPNLIVVKTTTGTAQTVAIAIDQPFRVGDQVNLIKRQLSPMDRLLPLPSLDAEVSKLLLREMKKRGIDCRPAARVAAAH